MDNARNILIFGEIDRDGLTAVTTQAMGIGKALAESLGGELHLLVAAGNRVHIGSTGFGYGADRVFTVVDPFLEAYIPEAFLQVMEQVVRHQGPGIVIFGQTDRGMDLAPRLAFRLKACVALDCIQLEAEETGKGRRLKQIKPVYGGKAHAVYCPEGSWPQIVSIREGAFEPAVFDAEKRGDVTSLNIPIDPSSVRTRFLESIPDPHLSSAVKLASAPVVVSGGRGLGSKEGFDLIEETAGLLGGAVGGSRPAVDNGWVPGVLQVGLTGKKVHPDVYFAVGISGAMQHMAGCRQAKTIVAVNNSAEAPIFHVSHYGVVGPYEEVLKGFNDEYRRIRACRKQVHAAGIPTV